MSQVNNNRNASAGKRARTDGGRREDDWTCPSCGNVNFSFRTTCNMHNCTQSRPAHHNTKSAPKAPYAPPSYTSSAGGYMGAAAPSSLYLGAPPYASSLLNGPALSPYNMRFTGSSAYQFDYGSRSVGSPYGHLHMSGPSPYSGGSMMGAGGMYGMSPFVDRYGIGLPMGHGSMAPRPVAFSEESSQKRTAVTGRDDDWNCPTCGNLNFAFRAVCNMRKCNTPKPGSQGPKFDNSKVSNKPKMPDGSWKCQKCNNINYPFRTKCNRQNCGADKPAEDNTAQGQSGDEDNQ